MIIDSVTKEQFKKCISLNKEDNFAKTFIAKCDMLNQWNSVLGCWIDGELCGAILVTISKGKPYCANLQLLHTFYKYRKRGVGKFLCKYVFNVVKDTAEYFRLSSELNSVEFYRKIGFKFWGKQKSGCYLSLFKIKGINISDGHYSIDDEYILRKTTPSKLRGSLYEKFKEVY